MKDKLLTMEGPEHLSKLLEDINQIWVFSFFKKDKYIIEICNILKSILS